MIFQDAENSLVTVTLFQRVVDEFKHKVNGRERDGRVSA